MVNVGKSSIHGAIGFDLQAKGVENVIRFSCLPNLRAKYPPGKSEGEEWCGGFLKWLYPTTMVFPLKMIILGFFGGGNTHVFNKKQVNQSPDVPRNSWPYDQGMAENPLVFPKWGLL